MKQAVKRPKTKAEKLRLASRICWLIGASMTVNFILIVMSATFTDSTVAMVAAVAIAFGLQYVLTLMESGLFDGSLPPPWRIEWSDGGPLPWIAVGAAACLTLDIMLNLGGVGMFMYHFEKAAANNVLTISDAAMGVIKIVGTVLFSALFAVGSELLEAYADHIDGTKSMMQPSRPVQHQSQQPAPQEHRAPQQEQSLKLRRHEQSEQQVSDLLRREAPPARVGRIVDANGNIKEN